MLSPTPLVMTTYLGVCSSLCLQLVSCAVTQDTSAMIKQVHGLIYFNKEQKKEKNIIWTTQNTAMMKAWKICAATMVFNHK